MLPKSKRLTTEDFKKLKKWRVLHTPHLMLRLASGSKGLEKFAIIVSSASYKRAVDRNLLRRRLYAIVEKSLSLVPGLYLTVTLKKGALAVTYSTLQKELEVALAKRTL